jgi:hypothetical protein
MYSWDTNKTAEVSFLNKNLVLKLPDYFTGKPVYSILGRKKIVESLDRLFEITDKLELVPQVIIDSLKDQDRYILTEDESSHDYIYNIDSLTSFAGGSYKKKRNKLSKFKADMGDSVKTLTHAHVTPKKAEELRLIYARWAKSTNQVEDDIKGEQKAVMRILGNFNKLNLLLTEVIHDNKIVAFSINEILSNNFAICHFEKADMIHPEVYTYLVNEVAKELQKHNCWQANWEQDLGIPGLRQSKKSFQPIYMFNKYFLEQIKTT